MSKWMGITSSTNFLLQHLASLKRSKASWTIITCIHVIFYNYTLHHMHSNYVCYISICTANEFIFIIVTSIAMVIVIINMCMYNIHLTKVYIYVHIIYIYILYKYMYHMLSSTSFDILERQLHRWRLSPRHRPGAPGACSASKIPSMICARIGIKEAKMGIFHMI
jgi:hypothetical protein